MGITPGFVVSVLATLAAAVVTGFLIFEDWALFNDRKPITEYTRSEERAHPHFFLILLAVLCLLLGHFLWH